MLVNAEPLVVPPVPFVDEDWRPVVNTTYQRHRQVRFYPLLQHLRDAEDSEAFKLKRVRLALQESLPPVLLDA